MSVRFKLITTFVLTLLATQGLCRSDETAAAQLRSLLARPMLLTAGDDSAAKRFSYVFWTQASNNGVVLVVERCDSSLAVISTFRDGTPMTVHVNQQLAEFHPYPRAGWVFGTGLRPHVRIGITERGLEFERQLAPKMEPASIYLDVASLARDMLRDVPHLRCSDGRTYTATVPSSNTEFTLETSKEPTRFPIVRYEAVHGDERSGIRILADADFKQHWTRKELTEVSAALHDEVASQEFNKDPIVVLKAPTGATRNLAWELPKRLNLTMIPNESVAERLCRTLARDSHCTSTEKSAATLFAIEREFQSDGKTVYKLRYERWGDELALLVRSAAGAPVALIRPGWMFALDPERGWVLSEGQFAKGGSVADKLVGWKLGRSLGDGGLSLDLFPSEATQKFINADWKFDAAKNQLTMTSEKSRIVLGITPDADDFPFRHVRVQIGESVDEQVFVIGAAMKPAWTRVTRDWLRSEFKPVEEEYTDRLYSTIVEQLTEGQSDAAREKSKLFNDAVMKLAGAAGN